jgi:hypothetical protein
LNAQTMIHPPPPGEVVLVVFEFARGPGEDGEVTIDLQRNAALPRVGQIGEPSRALQTGGLYIAVQDHAGEFVNLMRLSNPWNVRTEEDRAGLLESDVSRSSAGVVAARVSFIPEGSLKVFRTAGGHVTRAFLDMPLSPPALSGKRWRFRVPE